MPRLPEFRGGPYAGDDHAVLLSVLLHHDQSKTLDEIMAHLKQTGSASRPDKVRALNRYMEQKAWGAFRYQVSPAYDFAPIAAQLKRDHAAG